MSLTAVRRKDLEMEQEWMQEEPIGVLDRGVVVMLERSGGFER